MSLLEIETAKRESVRARQRLESTLAAAQARLRPVSLAEEAWDGVKGKGAEIAEGALDSVKKRPAAVSVALGALALFLAREPLKRAATRLISGASEEEERIEPAEPELSEKRPRTAKSEQARSVKKGVS